MRGEKGLHHGMWYLQDPNFPFLEKGQSFGGYVLRGQQGTLQEVCPGSGWCLEDSAFFLSLGLKKWNYQEWIQKWLGIILPNVLGRYRQNISGAWRGVDVFNGPHQVQHSAVSSLANKHYLYGWWFQSP